MADEASDASDWTLRRYEPRDSDAVRRLHERAMSAAGTDPGDVPGTGDLGWVEAAYLDTGGEFLVVEARESGGADESGTVVAMGGLLVDGATGELFRIAVDPDHQREGYGSIILDALEATARDRGVERIVLTTARRQAAALDFYPAHGYAETGRESHGEYELRHFGRPPFYRRISSPAGAACGYPAIKSWTKKRPLTAFAAGGNR